MKLLSLIKKEFHRFFHDPRLIITMLIPGILIYIIYTAIGSFMWQEKTYSYTVYLSGESQLTALIEKAAGENKLEWKEAGDKEAAKREVEAGEATAYVAFSEHFDEAVKDYTPANGTPAPLIEIYYCSADEESATFYALATNVLNTYESALTNKFDINRNQEESYDFSGTGDSIMSTMSGFLPFLVVIFIFSACMSITLESVAGEKERGTLATILVTSVKRSHVALGKIIPLSCISAIGAASSFLGVVLSMPKLMGMSVGFFAGGYSFWSYCLLLLLILSVVPLIVSLISVVSAYAKSVKEASAYTSVVMILTMVLSIVTAFVSGIGDWIVAIPILNAVVSMQGLLNMTMPVWQSLVSFGLNFVYTALLVWLISRMLSSEKLMFGN